MKIFLLAAIALAASAQTSLSLPEAVQQAATRHPSMEAAAERVKAAEARISQARSSYLPHATFQESVTGGNNPVYVFSSKLTQRQFTQGDFAIDSLIRPDPITNFQSLLTVEQNVWDFGRTKSAIGSAETGKKLSEEQRRQVQQALIAGVARAYHNVTLATEALRVAGEAVKSAEADLKKVETVRAAGMTTDADVLAVKVHWSSVREQQIQARYGVETAKAGLNEALGLPLDTVVNLKTPLTAASMPKTPGMEMEASATTARPEVRLSQLQETMASSQIAAARSALYPQVGIRGAFEADRQEFYRKGGANWVAGIALKWDFFDGKRNLAEVKVARHQLAAAQADQRRAESSVRLHVRKARADLESAQERIGVTDVVVAQAEETLRIVRNRYDNGLTTVTELLRSETALMDARMRKLAAVYDQRMAAVGLELAAGSLNGDSDVLQ